MIKHRKKLRDLVNTFQNKELFIPICDAFDCLAAVNNTVYKSKTNLSDADLRAAKTAITNMKTIWLKLGLPITVKTHGLFEHAYDILVKYRMTLAPLGEHVGESVHRLLELMKRFYPKHLGPEFAFKRFNAERFLPLPIKLTRAKKRQRTDSEVDVRPVAGLALQVAAEVALEDPDWGQNIELEDASDYIDNLLIEQTDVREEDVDGTQDLNSSLANAYIDEESTDDPICHLGENFDEISENFEADRRENYVMSEHYETNPLIEHIIEEL